MKKSLIISGIVITLVCALAITGDTTLLDSGVFAYDPIDPGGS